MTGLTNVPGGEAMRARDRPVPAAHRPGEVDLLVIGAGTTGLYQLYRARTEGFSALLLEAGLGVGGIRYGNNSFEAHFETDGDIRLGARVRSTVYDDRTGTWSVLTDRGVEYRARYVVAATGALRELGVRGRDGLRLSGYWADGPRTYLGVMTAGFPNFFFPGGPHGVPDDPRAPGDQVDFVTGALLHARDTGREVVEVGLAAEEEWTDLVRGTLVSSLLVGGRYRDPSMTVGDALDAVIFSEAGRAA